MISPLQLTNSDDYSTIEHHCDKAHHNREATIYYNATSIEKEEIIVTDRRPAIYSNSRASFNARI